MKYCAVALVLLSVLLYANCQTVVSSAETFGANITLNANTTYIISLSTPSLVASASAYLNVTSTSNCVIQVTQVSTVNVNFPNSIQNIQTGVNIGFNIQKFCSNGTLNLSYTYTLSSTLQAALKALTAFTVDAVQFDASANAYLDLNAQTQGSGNVTFYPQDWVPAGGNITFYIVAFNSSNFRQALYNRYALFRAGLNQTYQYSQGLVLSLMAQEDVYVNVTMPTTVNSHPSAPAPSDSSGSSAHMQGIAFMSFHAQPVQSSAQANFSATIQYTYNATLVAMEQIKAATLAFYKFVNGVWQAQANGYVNVQANVVVQSTNSFSDWAVYGQSTVATSSGHTSAASTVSSSGAFGINTLLFGVSVLFALLIAFLF